ncbi:DnaJ domain-containing protein [Gammaproteobacteria bacterium]|nr:DnaJ domain-containing protein [Gammaproteobacteria bacterium]
MSFDPNKDYYGILGVTSSAEMAVIKAAYKALAGIYHPDRNPSDGSGLKMQAINEAWSVLSDVQSRKEYDETLKGRKPAGDFSNESDEDEAINKYFEEDWGFALTYYPDLESLANRLARISRRLGISYKSYIVLEKKFRHRKAIAEQMEREFLENYFGKNSQILRISKEIIFELNDKELLRELNRAISILGTSDPAPIINKFDTILVVEKNRRWENQDKENTLREEDKSSVFGITLLTSLLMLTSIVVLIMLSSE